MTPPFHLFTFSPFNTAVEHPLALDINRKSRFVTKSGTAVHCGRMCHRGYFCDEEWHSLRWRSGGDEEWHSDGDKEWHRGGIEVTPGCYGGSTEVQQ